MKNIWDLLQTYLMVLVHPFRIHHQFRHSVYLPGHEGHRFDPLNLSEAIGISWVFAMIRGFAKLLLINYFLQAFMSLQSEKFPIFEDLIFSSGISTYYFLVFSAILDLIFFPIACLIKTEIWNWIIRLYGKWLNPELPVEEIADQITTHALSANFFSMIPFLGEFIESLSYYFLIFAGLRANLGASRSLAWVIFLTPSIALLMLLTLLVFIIFCLI